MQKRLENPTFQTIDNHDAIIHSRILAAIAGAPGLADCDLHVTVQHGSVTVSGVVSDDKQRGALVGIIRGLPDVRDVQVGALILTPISRVPDGAGDA